MKPILLRSAFNYPNNITVTGNFIARVIITVISFLLTNSALAVAVDSQIETELRTTHQAQVIISLADPVALDAPVRQRLTQVKSIQDSVLAQLPVEYFELKYRYYYVPGLVGFITQEALEILKTLPEVISIHLDAADEIQLMESIPLIQADNIPLPLSLDVDSEMSGRGINIALLDTGIDNRHPELSNDIAAQHCFVYSGCPPENSDESLSAEDDHGHGTHVAGIISSNSGIAQNATLTAIKVCNAVGQCWPSNSIAGLDWLLTHLNSQPVDIVNISLGGSQFSNVYDCENEIPAYTNVINQLVARGITVFSSSGNDGLAQEIKRPSCFSNTIAVAATYDSTVGAQDWSICRDTKTAADQVTCFSNTNALVDVVAPGALIASSQMNGSQTEMGGTSQAAPMAAGLAALMLEANPDLTPDLIRKKMQCSGIMVSDAKNGLSFPRINARAAVQAALGAGTIDFALAEYQIIENKGFTIIEVVRTEGSYGQISVAYTTSDQSAQSNKDYLPVEGTLVWEEGDTSVKTIMIEIINDDILESPETIGLTLFNPTDGACLGTLSETTLTISEPSVLQFSAPIYQVHEHEQWLSIEVTRTNSTQGVVAVDYSTLADSATENSDYLGIQEGTLKWDDGESDSQYIMLELVDDTEAESEEFLTLFLFNIQGDAQIGAVAAAQVGIIDNDALVSGEIQFATETYPVAAGEPSVTLEIQRIEGAQGAISVDYFTLDDSAVTPYDYVAAQGTLHWADGEVLSQYITIGINDDEPAALMPKTFEIKLSNATGGAQLSVIAQAQVVIEPEAQPESLPPELPQTPINTHLSSEPVDTIDSPRPYQSPPKKQVTIQVNGKGIGSVNSEPFGIHCGNYRAPKITAHCRSDFAFHCLADGGKQCDYRFNQGEAVTLTPTAGPNSVFMGWGGDPDCADGEITVTNNKQCWAYFSLLHPLTIHRIGSGSVHSYDLTGEANGIHCTPQSQRCIKRFNENQEIVLTVTPEEHFIGWEGDCQGNQSTILVKMQQAKTCIARFQQ